MSQITHKLPEAKPKMVNCTLGPSFFIVNWNIKPYLAIKKECPKSQFITRFGPFFIFLAKCCNVLFLCQWQDTCLIAADEKMKFFKYVKLWNFAIFTQSVQNALKLVSLWKIFRGIRIFGQILIGHVISAGNSKIWKNIIF